MDKASASGAGDCGFESHQGRYFFFFFLPLDVYLFPWYCILDACLEFLTHLALSHSSTSRNGSQTESIESRFGETGISTLVSL